MTSAIITGITVGLLYGLMGFAIVALFKMTGVANFAAGTTATLGATLALKLSDQANLNALAASALAILLTAGAGLMAYLLVMRVRDDVDHLSLTVRTVGLFLLGQALLEIWLGQGQPFAFGSVLPDISTTAAGLAIPSSTLWFPLVAVAVIGAFGLIFSHTRIGLLMRGLAADADTAGLLGARTRLLAAVAWSLSSGLAAVVGILAAPSRLISSDMMTSWLLYVFAGVVIGGMTSLAGAVIGGVGVGLVQGVTYQLASDEVALLAVFAVFLLTLLVRPHGLFGATVGERL
ncbi:branched-chain amino acid ABC transporter permease [Intrasporangium sp. DVR]|uniref:branched-chain amino acid ABC transporter permease n=1 Tax=Intrasporangium sp. DVR TaxID=3127867 RepID=UPI00313A6BA4